jgi:hypothetical protein
MALETGTYISDLNAANPTAADPKSAGDDHIRLLKSTVKATFPNLTGAVTATQAELNILDGATLSTAELNVLDGVTASTDELNLLDGVTATTAELNYIDGVTSPIQGQIDAKAGKSGATYTGTHDFTGATISVPTAATGSSGSSAASLDYVNATATNAALPAQTGKAGKVMGTNGTDAEWVSGGMKLLATMTPTVAAAVNALSVFSADYDSYVIVGQEIGTTNAAPSGTTHLQLRAAVAGAVDTSVTIALSGGTDQLAGTKMAFSFELLNVNGTAEKLAVGDVLTHDAFVANRVGAIGNVFTTASALTGLSFFWGDGSNFSATGKIYIYGRTKV